MTDSINFYQQVAQNYDLLTSNEQLVIDYIIHSSHINHLTIKTISQELFISSATIMRAAHKLGYDNFSQLKYSAAEANQIATKSLPTEEFATIVNRVAGDFDKTLQLLTEDKIARFAHFLQQARRIFCVGSGSSVSVMADFNRKMKLLGYWINDYAEIYSIRDIAELVHPGDVIVIFSLNGGNQLVNQYLVRSKVQGARIISITGMNAKTVINFSDYNLLVYESLVPRSRMRSRLMLNVAVDVVFEYLLSHSES
ncbi:MurR/RpiR family transcriptional regulator [Bombilactobacillus bombi]|uniref:MurR/RpiR family transcriptional regulator n=1 Tax=Bombilactobacillus bombi TaxID=1303590 RepID=UPI000E58AB9D|nr:MurR/RpiR family transcriptional regulator [Bombilactobacillus bombi]AXX64406.1 MurR/RpiR family transcriptional regulator [Bombilactobacillus bombi]